MIKFILATLLAIALGLGLGVYVEHFQPTLLVKIKKICSCINE